MTEKIALATDCRTSLMGSLIAFKFTQEALPHVDIPHITHRQIVAVSHANEYLFTDIVNSDRYEHTKHVLDAYQKSLNESITWLHNIFQTTLKNDLRDAENDVQSLAKKLRNIRSENIRMKIGFRSYEPIEQGQVSE